MAGRTNISGYLIVPVDLGHGVVCQDVIYIVDNIFGSNSKMFLGKPFLAIIDATIGVRYDYLAVPLSDGAPIHISGRKYLGNGIWEEVQFPKSTQAVLSKSRIAKARKEYAVEQDGNSVTHLEDNLGNYCRPWAGIIYSCTTGISQKGVEPSLPPESHDPLTASGIEQQLLQEKHGGWMGTEMISMAHFGRHVAALLCPQSPTAFSVEGGVSMGRGDLSTGLFAGYTSETAVEEGLTEFVVDNITWWACLEGVSTAQKKWSQDILRKNCPYVSTSVQEMRYCLPETIVHDLIPKDNAVWQIAKRRRQYAPLEMQWILTYIGSLLAAKIISPVDTGMVYSDENGQKIPIQQTSHATLAPKGKGNFRLCINYVYLNHQLHRHVWEI